jgi:hypothetical protein
MPKKQKRVLLVLSIVLLMTIVLPAATLAQFSYTPMENIPGFGSASDFPTYITNVYKFGVWTIGICAMLMIMIGGFMYLTSAGNNAAMGKAKVIITDALIGLILALASYVILYEINPELIKVKEIHGTLPIDAGTSGNTGNGNNRNTGNGNTGAGTGNGTCNEIPGDASKDCSTANLQNSCFGNNAAQASSICNKESGGNRAIPSGVDKCRDGNSASWGLFQINLTVHKVGGLNCPSAFSGGAYTSKNHNCTVSNQGLYDQCVAAAKDPTNNINAACGISNNGAHWGQWGANSKCGFQK